MGDACLAVRQWMPTTRPARPLTERGIAVNINRGLLFWGLALITAGATALAVQQGYIDRDTVAGAWRLWPVILIAIGLSIVLARTPFSVLGTVLAALILGVAGGAAFTSGVNVACTGDLPTDLQARSGGFSGGSANVTLDFNCGRLEVAMADGSDWEARTGVRGGRDVRLDADTDSLTIRSPEGGFGPGAGKQRWEIDLGSDPSYRLRVSANATDAVFDLAGGTFSEIDVDPNAGSLQFDLAGAEIGDFSISMNAGSAEIRADAETSLTGSISMNAGSTKLCVPDGAALRIRIGDNNLFSHNLDGSGLSRSGDSWTSEGFAGAARFVDLRVSGNAASFELNPEGGCS